MTTEQAAEMIDLLTSIEGWLAQAVYLLQVISIGVAFVYGASWFANTITALRSRHFFALAALLGLSSGASAQCIPPSVPYVPVAGDQCNPPPLPFGGQAGSNLFRLYLGPIGYSADPDSCTGPYSKGGPLCGCFAVAGTATNLDTGNSYSRLWIATNCSGSIEAVYVSLTSSSSWWQVSNYQIWGGASAWNAKIAEIQDNEACVTGVCGAVVPCEEIDADGDGCNSCVDYDESDPDVCGECDVDADGDGCNKCEDFDDNDVTICLECETIDADEDDCNSCLDPDDNDPEEDCTSDPMDPCNGDLDLDGIPNWQDPDSFGGDPPEWLTDWNDGKCDCDRTEEGNDGRGKWRLKGRSGTSCAYYVCDCRCEVDADGDRCCAQQDEDDDDPEVGCFTCLDRLRDRIYGIEAGEVDGEEWEWGQHMSQYPSRFKSSAHGFRELEDADYEAERLVLEPHGDLDWFSGGWSLGLNWSSGQFIGSASDDDFLDAASEQIVFLQQSAHLFLSVLVVSLGLSRVFDSFLLLKG